MKVTPEMLGAAIQTAEELAVVKRTSAKSYAKWLCFLVDATAKAPADRTEAEHRAIQLATQQE